jgi:hypothetical protein
VRRNERELARTMRKKARKKLRVIMLADETLLPAGDLKDYSEKQRELRKTEFDVRDAIETLGHEVFSIGVSDDLSTIRGAIDAHKPHIAFNLVEEFGGVAHFDQHVVSYLELRKHAYIGCSPRGLTLARDKALTKKILAYHGLKVPEFAVFAKRRAMKRPASLAFPLFVKSLTEEDRLEFLELRSSTTMQSSRNGWHLSSAASFSVQIWTNLPYDPIDFIGKPVLPILLQRALRKAEGLTEP